MKKVKVLKNQLALELLSQYDIPTLHYKKLSGAHEIRKFPSVLKTDSPAILHKAERKGVHVVHHKEQANKKFHKLRKHGSVICQQHAEGHHFTIQVLHPLKGRKSLFLGSSGASSEVHNDFSIQTCPITQKAARKMMEELKTYNYVLTFQGKKTRLDVLEKTLVALSKLAIKEKVKSLEIDPFILNHKFGGVADAKIVLR